ncbi:LEA type 2 family protein [Candidatus Neomarinimicrobiota bacterium]
MIKLASRNPIILVLITLILCAPANAQLDKLKKDLKKSVSEAVKPLEIEFEVTSVKYDPLKDAKNIKVKMLFSGHNPNGVGIKLNRIEFDLFIDDKLAAKMYNDEKIEMPKESPFSFEEKAKIKLKTVGKTVLKAMKDDKVAYKIVGTYFVDTKLGTFSFKADLVEKGK